MKTILESSKYISLFHQSISGFLLFPITLLKYLIFIIPKDKNKNTYIIFIILLIIWTTLVLISISPLLHELDYFYIPLFP